jgi:RNA polymerase sigma-70 factor, ECF subfamily
VCRRITGTPSDADDACQEAMIKIVRNLPRFDGRSSFATWAYRIATNAALDELRRRKRRPTLELVDDQGREPVDHRASGHNDRVVDRLAIDEALDELGEDFRVAVVLRDVIDLDYQEIAAMLDIPVGTVKSRIARGRSQLATSLRLDDLPPLPPDDTTAPDTSTSGTKASDDTNLLASGNQPDVSERPNEL